MPSPNPPSGHLAFYRAAAVSLAIHAIVLALPHAETKRAALASAPLQARLAPRVATPPAPEPSTAPRPAANVGKQKQRDVIHVDRPPNADKPTWTIAQKAEMDSFLNELSDEARRNPPPTLAQRSLAMAREAGREIARADEAGDALLEPRPNGPPPNPFSLDFYLEGLVRRLNRSAGFVNSERRHVGVLTAAVQFRLNPDGTLKSFVVLNAADQGDEIAFIKAVIERSTPFAAFPPDIDKAARSLGVTICIRPNRHGESGFTRMQGGRCL